MVAVLKKKEESSDVLQLDKDILRKIYKHVDILADSKYREPIKILATRNQGYMAEDFVQEAVAEVCKTFDTKVFTTWSKLKSFINCVVEFHYLHQKRKYFHTKSRGEATVLHFEDEIEEKKAYEELIPSIDPELPVENLGLKLLMEKNLYVIFDWKTAKVCTLQEIRKQRKQLAIQVNHFIMRQYEFGMKETCRYYKDKGFYMTQAIFEQISKAIIDYAKENDLLIVDKETKTYVYNRPAPFDPAVTLRHLANKCTCGYIKEDFTFDETTWQCPICGKIHDRDTLIKFNRGLDISYKPKETKQIVLNISKRLSNSLMTNTIKV